MGIASNFHVADAELPAAMCELYFAFISTSAPEKMFLFHANVLLEAGFHSFKLAHCAL